MINLLYNLTFYIMLIGIGIVLYDNIRAKTWLRLLANIFIPFYMIYYVLKKMEEQNPRKRYAAICILGAFVIFFFVSILKILFLEPT
ncbi:hypothetical protein COTS27_00404 [Spirochaetota bacterium]|nr:hypothetical protein COTS27_00404 [Spirochaetota bacterium]